MAEKDNPVDAYIQNSAAFAQPILYHLRELVHIASPQVEEKIKWAFPNFDYKGPICNMAAFKQHASFGFWKAAIMPDPDKLFAKNADQAMGHLGQIKQMSDLPSDKILLKYLKAAVKLNEEGEKLPSRNKVVDKTLIIPDDFKAALRSNKKAYKVFADFSYSHKKEYLEWITEAKTEATRQKRIVQAIEWIAEGKSRNWKYSK